MEIITPTERGLNESDKQTMRDHLEKVMGFFPNELGALVIVGIGLDGSFSRATRISPTGIVGQTLLPSFVAEILRRDVADSVVREIFS